MSPRRACRYCYSGGDVVSRDLQFAQEAASSEGSCRSPRGSGLVFATEATESTEDEKSKVSVSSVASLGTKLRGGFPTVALQSHQFNRSAPFVCCGSLDLLESVS